MKKSAFVYIIIIPGLLLAGWRVCMASTSDASGTLLKSQTREDRVDPLSRRLLADRTDTRDSIIYGTDPEMERAMEEQVREEKKKEEKAWKMLEHMDIRLDTQKRPSQSQPNNTAPQ